jgi:hypothetical protein
MVYLASTIGSFHFEQPWMTGEYWAGWYDAWGGKHARTDGELEAKELDWMLGLGYSVNQLSGWQVYPLPMTGPEGLQGWETRAIPGPAFHRGMFTIASVADTYLDVSKLGKGFVWVNGHNLGRSWSIGPQQSLFSSGTLVAEGLESGGGL